MRWLWVALVLAGCAGREPPRVPAALQVCPDPAPAPTPPPRPRTVDSVLDWGIGQAEARARDQAALRECGRRLDRLNEWIEERAR